jgi:NAD(P)-dependent dehydrogenase (short-subunit alcohol dehydrogenase family)
VELGLKGRTAVVTGASRGIGLAVVRALVDAGAQVVAGARGSSPELDDLAVTGAVRVLGVDLSEPGGPDRLVEFAGGRVDVLVNNVGAAPARTSGFLEVDDEMWRATFALNLMPAVRTTRAVLPGMLDAGRGAIVTVASVNARLPDPAVIDYSAAKAALVAFSKALSKEVGPRGVRVNTVSPGPVATALWLGAGGVADELAAASGTDRDEVVAQARQSMVTGRFSTPEEVAAVVAFLAGDVSGNLTGADVTIDGGLVPTW